MTIRDIAIAFGYELDASSEKKVNDSIKGLKNMATKALGAIGIGFSLSQANALIEQFKATNLQLKSVTGNLADQGKLQDDIMQKAASTRVSYATTAKAVSDYVSQSKKVLRTSDAALNFVELSTKAWKAAGKEESAIASLHSTLAKAFQKNIIDAGTFETLLSQSPETIKYLEKSLGKSRVQFKAMATAGVLTASQLTAAFTNSADEINAAYAETGVTISEAMQIAKDKIGLVLTQSDEGIKLTTTIAQLILKATDYALKGLKMVVSAFEKLTKALGGTQKALKLMAVIMAAMFAVSQIAKIKIAIDAYKGLTAAQKAANKQMLIGKLNVLAVVAAIVMLFLIIEDIVGFINGKDSVFGDLLKKAGFDVESIRTKLKDFYDKAKEKVESAIGYLKEHGESIVKGIMKVVVALGMLNLIIQTVRAGIAIYNGIMAAKILIDKLAAAAATELGFAGVFAAVGISAIVVIIAVVIAALALLVVWIIKNKDKILAWINNLKDKISAWWDGVKETCSNKFSEIVEKVKSFFGKIIEWFKSNWPALLLLLVNPFLGGFMLLYNNSEKFRNFINNLLEKIKEKFGEMKEKLKNKVAEWKDGIVEGFEAVKTWFEDLPKRAWQWGKDMLKNFVDGIKGGKSDVEEAVGGVTEPIESNLHHSVPDEGPLKDDDKWMPDFISNIAGGIRKGLPKVRAAVQGIVSELAVFASGAPTNVTQQMSQGATSTRIVNQYNNWTNNFNGGTKQEQADLADASDKQTTVASRKLGVELAYTR